MYKTDNKKRIPQPPSQWVRGKGQHIPLWDMPTYYAILAEQERRNGLRARGKTYALTGLLTCTVCKTNIHRHGSEPYIYLACRFDLPHVSLRYKKTLELVANAVVNALKQYKETSSPITRVDTFASQIKTQQDLRARIQEGYEGGLYSLLESKKRIVAVETEIDRLTRAQSRAAQQHVQKTAMLQFAGQDLDRMREWIINDDPTQVNIFLTSLCKTVWISPQQEITVEWRD